jgi:hypothetical protein
MQSDKVLYLDATSTLIVWSGAETIGELDDYRPLDRDRSIESPYDGRCIARDVDAPCPARCRHDSINLSDDWRMWEGVRG